MKYYLILGMTFSCVLKHGYTFKTVCLVILFWKPKQPGGNGQRVYNFTYLRDLKKAKDTESRIEVTNNWSMAGYRAFVEGNEKLGVSITVAFRQHYDCI